MVRPRARPALHQQALRLPPHRHRQPPRASRRLLPHRQRRRLLRPRSRSSRTRPAAHKSKPFTITLPARIDYTFTGRGNFIGHIEATDGSLSEAFANAIGSYKATTWLYGDGVSARVYLDILADGKYTVTVTSDLMGDVAALPVTYKSGSNIVTTPFSADGEVSIKYRHKGTSNFIVHIVDAETGDAVDGVVNEIGKVSSETSEYGLSGVYALDVVADGAWTVSISSQ